MFRRAPRGVETRRNPVPDGTDHRTQDASPGSTVTTMQEKTTKRAGRTTRSSTATTPTSASPAAPAPVPASDSAAASAQRTQDPPAPADTAEAGSPARTTKRRAPSKAAAAAPAPARAKTARTSRARKADAPAAAAKATPSRKAPAPRARKAPAEPAAPRPSTDIAAMTPAMAGPSLSVLIVASEAAPFSRTGGLGDLAGGLPAALGALGHRVTLVVPRYAGESRGVPVDRFSVRLGGHAEDAACYEVPIGPNARAILVEHAGFFDRDALYGEGHEDYADNPRRFTFLCRAALEFAARAGEAVDVVHAHDWQTALAPVLLRTEYAGVPALEGAASVLTIHDIGFQGLCAPEWLGMLGLAPSLYSMDGLEFWGRLSPLKGGIVFADVVCTLGATYARQLVSGDRPSGLEGVLAGRGTAFFGVIDDEQGSGAPEMAELARRFAEVFAHARGTRATAAPQLS